jgi:hypothetical protein
MPFTHPLLREVTIGQNLSGDGDDSRASSQVVPLLYGGAMLRRPAIGLGRDDGGRGIGLPVVVSVRWGLGVPGMAWA